jgi:hypothetical protein
MLPETDSPVCGPQSPSFEQLKKQAHAGFTSCMGFSMPPVCLIWLFGVVLNLFPNDSELIQNRFSCTELFFIFRTVYLF